MQKRRSLHLACHDCSFPLTRDERDHYVYQCHACVMAEHELLLTLKSDPEHPDSDRLFSGPVHLGLGCGSPEYEGTFLVPELPSR